MKLFAGPNAHRVVEGCIEQISRCDLYFVINRKTQVFCNIFVEKFYGEFDYEWNPPNYD